MNASRPQCLLADGPAGESAAARRHRTLTELKRTVRQHPAVDVAAGVDAGDGHFRELEVTFDARILAVGADEAWLRIEWRPRPNPSEPAYFVFHYWDTTGRDFGWYREPNPHVDGLEHFQARDAPGGEYAYEPANLGGSSPVELCWEILGWIEDRI